MSTWNEQIWYCDQNQGSFSPYKVLIVNALCITVAVMFGLVKLLTLYCSFFTFLVCSTVDVSISWRPRGKAASLIVCQIGGLIFHQMYVLFCNIWRQKTVEGLANSGSRGILPEKWRWCRTCICVVHVVCGICIVIWKCNPTGHYRHSSRP